MTMMRTIYANFSRRHTHTNTNTRTLVMDEIGYSGLTMRGGGGLTAGPPREHVNKFAFLTKTHTKNA